MSLCVFSDGNFQTEVINSNQVVLVDFWAPWCGPCKTIEPTIESIAMEKAGVIKVGKLNVDDNPLTASKYGILSIPTMIIFKGGKQIEVIHGAQPKEVIESLIENALYE